MLTKEQTRVVSTPVMQNVSAIPTNLSILIDPMKQTNVMPHSQVNGEKMRFQVDQINKRQRNLDKTAVIGSRVGDVTGTAKAREYSFPQLLKSNVNLFT